MELLKAEGDELDGELSAVEGEAGNASRNGVRALLGRHAHQQLLVFDEVMHEVVSAANVGVADTSAAPRPVGIWGSGAGGWTPNWTPEAVLGGLETPAKMAYLQARR